MYFSYTHNIYLLVTELSIEKLYFSFRLLQMRILFLINNLSHNPQDPQNQ